MVVAASVDDAGCDAETLARAWQVGWGAFGLGVGLALLATLIARHRHLRGSPLFAGWVLVVAHPGVWMGASSADCGHARVAACGLFTLLFVAVVVWARMRPVPARPDGR